MKKKTLVVLSGLLVAALWMGIALPVSRVAQGDNTDSQQLRTQSSTFKRLEERRDYLRTVLAEDIAQGKFTNRSSFSGLGVRQDEVLTVSHDRLSFLWQITQAARSGEVTTMLCTLPRPTGSTILQGTMSCQYVQPSVAISGEWRYDPTRDVWVMASTNGKQHVYARESGRSDNTHISFGRFQQVIPTSLWDIPSAVSGTIEVADSVAVLSLRMLVDIESGPMDIAICDISELLRELRAAGSLSLEDECWWEGERQQLVLEVAGRPLRYRLRLAGMLFDELRSEQAIEEQLWASSVAEWGVGAFEGSVSFPGESIGEWASLEVTAERAVAKRNPVGDVTSSHVVELCNVDFTTIVPSTYRTYWKEELRRFLVGTASALRRVGTVWCQRRWNAEGYSAVLDIYEGHGAMEFDPRDQSWTVTGLERDSTREVMFKYKGRTLGLSEIVSLNRALPVVPP